MLRSDFPDLQPVRSYEELMELSMRRGRTLQRRRRLVQTSPFALTLILAVVLPLSNVMGGHDGLARLDTTNVVPAHTPTPAPSATAQETHRPAPTDDRRATVSGRRAGSGSGGTAPLPAAPTALPISPRSDSRSVPSQPIQVQPPVVLRWTDAVGDATPQPPQGPEAQAPSSASDPTLDITTMRFTGDDRGLTVAMHLAADYRTDGQYLAWFTDDRTGCTFTVGLGGAYHDQLTWSCSSGSGGTWLPGTVDPTARDLVAFVPYSYFPAGTRRTDRLSSLHGETRLVHAMDGSWPYDEAATALTFRPRR